MEIKHENMLVRNKFLVPKTENVKYTRSLEQSMYPEKLFGSFTAVKKQQQKYPKISPTNQKCPRFGACLTNCPRSLKIIVQTYR